MSEEKKPYREFWIQVDEHGLLSCSWSELKTYQQQFHVIEARYVKKLESEIKILRDGLEMINPLHTPGDIKDWGPNECFAKCQQLARQTLEAADAVRLGKKEGE